MLDAGARLYGAGWEIRRRAYARGLKRPLAVPARVVSVGNLTVGGTGKTTLTLDLARRARERGVNVAVVCRRYRPGPEGSGDEERLYRHSLGAERVYAGRSKRDGAARASAEGRSLVLVDDGFSHWTLARDLDLVLLDARDPWGSGRLLPEGRLREPRRALQRAGVVVVSRLGPDEDAQPFMEEARRYAPAALIAAARHRVERVRRLDGSPAAAAGPAVVVTGTGNPRAVETSVREAGFGPTELVAYRDHHWFTRAEAERELERARRGNAALVLSAKDAVRWPGEVADARIVIVEIAWQWVSGGEAVERAVFGEGER